MTPTPPPRLSKGLDPPLLCRSKKVSQTHQDLEKDFSSFFLALSRWRERVGNLSNDDGNVNEKGKKSNRFRLAKQQPCTWITLLCTFFVVRKRQISRLVEDGNSRQRHFLFLFLNFSSVFWNSTPEKIVNIWSIKQDEISAKKIEAARLLFLSDVFVSVEAPYYGLTGGALIRGRPFIRAWALIQGNT